MDKPTTRGMNISHLQLVLLEDMDGDDATSLVNQIEQLMHELPDPEQQFKSRQGLLLGLVQSGKTSALTTTIAMAADNGYRCFIVLTSDNNWLYDQTIGRLKRNLQAIEIEGKQQWDGQILMSGNIQPDGSGLILVTTKNATVLRSLITALDHLRDFCGGELPPALIIDDEADQASLDTQTSKRAKNPQTPPGSISNLIDQIRQRFSRHVLLEVTATPQALFLQDSDHPYRPEFITLIEPGKGYTGGNTFFSLDLTRVETLIRHIDQAELDRMLVHNNTDIPASLWRAVCIFFIAATIKYLLHEAKRLAGNSLIKDPKYSFLCHISQKKADHEKAYNAISRCHRIIQWGLNPMATDQERKHVKDSLGAAWDDIGLTLKRDSNSGIPEFEKVLEELKNFIVGTEVQILNSDREADQPRYDRRYNILIGGNKLSRGVTIKNLIVTYYGRKAKSPNMDTVLQHARMYGYREKDLDVTRVFLTPEVERRFRLINESEQALRGVIERYPGKEYKGIRIGPGVKATRSNILNPNNIGTYAAGRSYFPNKPLSEKDEIEESTKILDDKLRQFQPKNREPATPITLDQAIELIQLTKSDPLGGGLWDTDRIIAALATLKESAIYNNTAYLVVRRDRRLGPNADGKLRAVFGGASGNYPGDESFANTAYPTLFMFRLTGVRWNGHPFWVPLVRFPDGQYALLFNFD